MLKNLLNIHQDLHALIGKFRKQLKSLENNLAAIHEKKISLTLNKPIYVGFTYYKYVNGKCTIFIIIL